jgi:hypothetical protein
VFALGRSVQIAYLTLLHNRMIKSGVNVSGVNTVSANKEDAQFASDHDQIIHCSAY